MSRAKQLLLFFLYYDQDFKPQLTKQQRDHLIRERYKLGEGISNLAREFGISAQRVFQIVKPKPRIR